MKTLSIFVFLFFSFQIIWAQPKPSRVVHQKINGTGSWKNYEATDYIYDDNGNVIVEHYQEYDTIKNKWVDDFKRINGYDKRNNHTHLYWEKIDSNGVWTKGPTEYNWEYNEDNCLETKEIINPGGWWIAGNYYLTHYYYSEGCKIDKIVEYDIFIEPDSTENIEFKKTYKYRYENNGKKIIQDFCQEWGDNYFYSVEDARIGEYDEHGRTILYIDSLTDYGAERYEYSYLPTGERKTKDFYHWRGEWKHEQHKEIKRWYNENGQLSRFETSIFYAPLLNSSPSIFFFNYDYYCDGLVRTRFNNTHKYIHFYTEPTDCFELPEDGIDALVFPNPVNDILHIYSAAFQSGDMVISIYDTKGRMVFRKEMEGRNEQLEIDVSGFINGIYFVNLTGLGVTKTVRVLVHRQ